MPPTFQVFTPAQTKLIQDMIDTLRRQVVNPRNRPHFETESQSPEVYLARTPSHGIPAMSSGLTPGSAERLVYQLVGSALVIAEPTVTVYNVGSAAIAGTSWVIVSRDKFGAWYAVGMGSGGGGYTGCLPRLNPCNNLHQYERYVNGDLVSVDSSNPCPECPPPGTSTAGCPCIAMTCFELMQLVFGGLPGSCETLKHVLMYGPKGCVWETRIRWTPATSPTSPTSNVAVQFFYWSPTNTYYFLMQDTYYNGGNAYLDAAFGISNKQGIIAVYSKQGAWNCSSDLVMNLVSGLYDESYYDICQSFPGGGTIAPTVTIRPCGNYTGTGTFPGTGTAGGCDLHITFSDDGLAPDATSVTVNGAGFSTDVGNDFVILTDSTNAVIYSGNPTSATSTSMEVPINVVPAFGPLDATVYSGQCSDGPTQVADIGGGPFWCVTRTNPGNVCTNPNSPTWISDALACVSNGEIDTVNGVPGGEPSVGASITYDGGVSLCTGNISAGPYNSRLACQVNCGVGTGTGTSIGGGCGTPGSTCAAAGNLPVNGDTCSGTVTNSDWWVFPIVSGKTYTVTYTSSSGNTLLAQTGSCSALTTVLTLPTSGSGSFVAGADGECWIQINGPIIGANDYTVAVGD